MPRFWRVLALLLVLRVIVFTILIGWESMSPTPPHAIAGHYVDTKPMLAPVEQVFVKWDAYWYLHIAEHGYQSYVPGTGASSAAFAPLYPFAMRCLNRIGLPAWLAGVLISNACFVGFLYYLYQLGQRMRSAEFSRRLMIFVSLFPSAWVFSMVYAESMFCLTTAAFFVHYDRKNFVRAGLLAALSPLVRVVGVVLVPALLIDLIVRRIRGSVDRGRWVTLVGAAAGLMALATVYYVSVGDALAFFHAGLAWPSRIEVDDAPIPLAWSFALHAWDRSEVWLHAGFFIAFAIGGMQLLARSPRIHGYYVALYLCALTQIPCICQTRFLLACVPGHLPLVGWLMRSPSVFTIVCTLMGLMQIIYARLALTWTLVS